VDRMNSAVGAAVGLLKPNGWLAVMTTEAAVSGVMAAGDGMHWQNRSRMPGSERQVLLLGSRRDVR
jgi:hypothetical protein